ncbi:hypothetical protein ACL07V_28495 [Streptomyces sp. MB22_4]|uniref:hypothetical protein n=1 Tax=Streptomyces sp. MB22_4 TaxID=3383120 RepID=UPI0039A09C37
MSRAARDQDQSWAIARRRPAATWSRGPASQRAARSMVSRSASAVRRAPPEYYAAAARDIANVQGQPLIMDPSTAIDTFLRTSLDRLYVEGFVVRKP